MPIVTTGEITAAAGDAYGASQAPGGLGSPANQASFGAAVAAAASAWASAVSTPGKLPFLNGLATGLAPAASAAQLALNISNLLNPSNTAADSLAAALGILGGAAGTLASLIPPAAGLTPQGAAVKATLTGIAVAASAAQLSVQLNSGAVNELVNEIVNSWGSLNTQSGLFDVLNGVTEFFLEALSFTPSIDPLVLDLDGDGLELTAATGQVLFDHNADGIRTGTGWVASDDGLLVWDRNANGLIDSGRELFGVDMIKANGQFALDGFDALRDLDANGDSAFTSADAAYSQVRLWRDLDQDGVTDAGELASLAASNIAQISLANTAREGLHNSALWPAACMS